MGGRVAIVIPTFNGAWRLARLFESVERFDPLAFANADWYVVEDPSQDYATQCYTRLLGRYPFTFHKLSEWSNLHGAASKAFDHVVRCDDHLEWVVYLGDDLLVTPLALSNLLFFLKNNALESVGLVQLPYWNAHDLCEVATRGEWQGPAFLKCKDDMYAQSCDWLSEVPRNPHWDQVPWAFSYINVNGVGFACKITNFYAVGGFAPTTWCIDESISVRTWLRSNLSVVALPGPPVVHYFEAASALSNVPRHEAFLPSAWKADFGMTKDECSNLCYLKMFEREPRVSLEMKSASYFDCPIHV